MSGGRWKVLPVPVTEQAAPKCFTPVSWSLWLESVKAMSFAKVPRRFCMDCSASHQKKMIAEGRCAFPDSKAYEKGQDLDFEIFSKTQDFIWADRIISSPGLRERPTDVGDNGKPIR